MNPIYKFLLHTDTQDNMFDEYDPGYTPGYSVNPNTGGLTSNKPYASTGYIAIVPGAWYIVNPLRMTAFYDKNKRYVSGSNYLGGETGHTYIVQVPEDAYYMRCSINTRNDGELDAYYIFSIYESFPIYKDDLAKDYGLETNQRFYREKLSGKISFIRSDFDYINNHPFGAMFYLHVMRSDDMGMSWSRDFDGKFMKTDCTFNNDDKKVQVQPDVLDAYSDVLAGLDKEYDLVPLAIEIERILIQKRPMIQIYIPGDSVVSCFLGGSYWEQDANATTDVNVLLNTYHFALSNLLKEINVQGSSNPDVSGLYVGRMNLNGSDFTGELRSETNEKYYINARQKYSPPFWGYVIYEVIRSSDNKVLFRYQETMSGLYPFDDKDFDFTAVSDSGSVGTPHAEMKTYNIYTRYLLDVNTLLGENTYELSSNDIVEYNRNYRRAIGYNLDVAYISNNYSTAPSEWGRRDDGTYFQPPYYPGKPTFYPIARSTWRYASIWFHPDALDEKTEVAGRKTYTLRDAYPISSVIQSLLKQFAPGITHEETEEYSRFLYGDDNPVVPGQKFRLFVTPKSNILVGDYRQPAQKAKATLQQLTNMLRDCFRCFWYIEENKFRIEHISWFRNGGSYSDNSVIGTDLTQFENIRNGKKWGFATSEYSFDKVDMPERFQFHWMDDVTTAFEGLPIEVLSKYVTEGKIEDINISNFTSDVDMMMLSPGEMSKDGFGLLAAVKANALTNDDTGLYPGTGGTRGTNGLTTPTYGVLQECVGRKAVIKFVPQSNGNAGTGRIVFLDSSGNVISTQGNFNADGHMKQITVNIPNDATAIGLTVRETVTAYFYRLEVSDQYELPFVRTSIGGDNYLLQNGYLAFANLQPNYWTYDLPAKRVKINGENYSANGIDRKKKQTLNFPMFEDPNPMQLVKTYIGNGEIDKMSVNLLSRSSKTTLKYDTE